MSENKCPFCGDAMITTEDKIVVCENADCATMFNEWDYPKVCAAMEFAMAEAWFMETEDFDWSGPLREDNADAFTEWDHISFQAAEDLNKAQRRVLEVFK